MSPRKPCRIKIFNNRAMVYLNGASGAVALIDTEDVEKVRPYSWFISAKSYAGAHVSGRRGWPITMHRLIMDAPPGHMLCVDHINRNTLDNRKSNLRITSRSQNALNTDKYGVNRGVYFDKARNKWAAEFKFDKKRHRLGRFDTKDEAISARIEAEKKQLGYALERGKNE